MTGAGAGQLPAPRARVVLVTAVGAAAGSRAAAAALACAGFEPDRAGLLIDLGEARAPRPSLVATAPARGLEERLVAHLPAVPVASRGGFCHLSLPSTQEGVERIPAALPLARDSVAVLHLPPRLLQPVLGEMRIQPSAALLRADLNRDRALTALAARDLMGRGICVAVLKRPLGWIAGRAASLGVVGDRGLPARVVERLTGEVSSDASGEWYRRQQDAETESGQTNKPAHSQQRQAARAAGR